MLEKDDLSSGDVAFKRTSGELLFVLPQSLRRAWGRSCFDP